MKTFSTHRSWQVERPFRAFGLTWAAASSLFFIFTPFMDDVPNKWLFLFAGIGYAALLSFFAIGLCLLPVAVRGRVFGLAHVIPVFALAINVGILLAIRAGRFDLVGPVLTPLMWVWGTAVFVLCALAGGGWFFRFMQGLNRFV